MADDRPFVYFHPRQLAMRVQHRAEDALPQKSLEKTLDEIWAWIATIAGDPPINKPVKISPANPDVKRHFTFAMPSDSPTPFTTYAFRDIVGLAPQDLPKLVRVINEKANKKTILNDQNEVVAHLDMMDLNWLSVAGDWPGDGGPGGPPKPYPMPPPPPPPTPPNPLPNPVPFEFEGPALTAVRSRGLGGEGITVVILDTAPTEKEMDDAYKKWVTNAQGVPPHPLLQRLWGDVASRKLREIKGMKPSTRARLAPFSLKEHPYKITDHGLFVAGVINTIVRAAEIYLYEALNERGVCDSESVLSGLEWIHTNPDFKGKDIVINCSLFVVIPHHEGHFNTDLTYWFHAESPWDNVQDMLEWLTFQASFNEATFALFNTAHSAVVAAAGNDWHDGQGDRPGPRFPAGFDSVLGVGALEEVDFTVPPYIKSAEYSNLDDVPLNMGISAFGGGLASDKGMIGVFISDNYPLGGGNNKYGWARWAGTSFATPLVTGFIAALMGDPSLPKTAGIPANVLRALTYHQGNENALIVKQV